MTRDPLLLLSDQNSDGGWGYRRASSSATEPTSYALLALANAGGAAEALRRGVLWLKSNQQADGGWPPRSGIHQSTWVTALPLLLPREMRAAFDVPRALDFLAAQTGRESSLIHRARMLLLGETGLAGSADAGWPWFPETAAWVSPTALTILALERIQRERPSREIEKRCESGRKYLLSHRCVDAGWNHGSTKALGYDSGSYPETTGVALLALHGQQGLENSLKLAEESLSQVASAEAESWLRLALLAHRRSTPEPASGRPQPRTVVDVALGLISDAARNGSNAFLD